MTLAVAAYKLTFQSGPMRGKTMRVKDMVTIGREASCDVVLDDPKVSRHHGTFRVRDGRLFYQDNKSTNGSFLNGERVADCEMLQGDVLKLGGTELALLEESDFRTINFVNHESMITNVVATNSVRPDALAQKFAAVFEYYKEHVPEVSEAERYELVRTQRLLNGMKTIYSMSQTMTKLVPLQELLEQIARNLFDLFAGAENLVILLEDPEKRQMEPRLASTRNAAELPSVSISQTVLDRAIAERCTLIANDAATDHRLRQSDSIIGFSVKSVMCAPLVSGDHVLGALYLDNRLENVRYDDMDAELATAFANQCAIALENAYLCDSLQKHYLQTLQSLVNAIEAKDPYTLGHTERVSVYAVGIGREYGLDEKRLERLKLAADLHDIGKIGIKEGIINKRGKLTETEFSTIKDHVEMGEKILRPLTYLHDILPFIRGHHERWDGSGYPDGLRGEECPVEARILALADAFDAMTSQRSYNKPLTISEAQLRVRQGSGTHFDPAVVQAFERYLQGELVHDTPKSNRPVSSATAQPLPQAAAGNPPLH